MQKPAIRNILVAVGIVLIWPVFLHAPTYYGESRLDEPYIMAPLFALPMYIAWYTFSLTRGTIWERSVPIAFAPLLAIPLTIAVYGRDVYGEDLEQVYFFASAPALIYWLVLVGIAEGSPTQRPHTEENDV